MSETNHDPQKCVTTVKTPSADHTKASSVRSVRDEDVFAAKVDKIVADQMPRMFAMCEEIGEDAQVVAWGLSFKDHAEMILADDGKQRHFLFSSAEYAPQELTARSKHCTLRLVWADQAQEQAKSA